MKFPFWPQEIELKKEKKYFVIFIVIAISLTLVKYFGTASNIWKEETINLGIRSLLYHETYGELNRKIYWVTAIILFQLLLPLLFAKIYLKQNPTDLAMSFRVKKRDWKLYFILCSIMLPLIFLASLTEAFQNKYPFVQPDIGKLFPIFFIWQLFYFFQFIAVEFFFRGFIIHSLKPRLGIYAVFVSLIPYCMIHFGKPFGETLGAIVAGLVLGVISYRENSIALGVILHYTIAICMDLASLFQKGYFYF